MHIMRDARIFKKGLCDIIVFSLKILVLVIELSFSAVSDGSDDASANEWGHPYSGAAGSLSEAAGGVADSATKATTTATRERCWRLVRTCKPDVIRYYPEQVLYLYKLRYSRTTLLQRLLQPTIYYVSSARVGLTLFMAHTGLNCTSPGCSGTARSIRKGLSVLVHVQYANSGEICFLI